MFVLPYETTICGIYSVPRLTDAVKRANIESPFPVLTTPAGNIIEKACFITPRDEHVDVPTITQFLNMGDAKKPKLVVDARPYMRYDARNDTYRLTAENDYAFLCARVALTLALLEQDAPGELGRFGDVPAKTFARWITMGLASKYNLPLEHQMSLSVIATYYYYTMVNPELTVDLEARTLIAATVSRISGAPVEYVLRMAERLEPAKNATELAAQISTQAGTLRFGEIKFIDFYTLMSNSWIGVNSKENAGVALEHLPTFIAMCYAAIGERSYRKTILTRRAESAGRQHELQQFNNLVFGRISEQFKG